jgi:hypothetical protein
MYICIYIMSCGPTNLYLETHNQPSLDIVGILKNHVENNIPIVFLKFGDGEALAALTPQERYKYMGNSNQNCDNTKYTEKLRIGLLNSIKYFVDKTPNSYIGLYDLKFVKELWEKNVTHPIKWAKYHTLMMYSPDSLKYSLYLSVRESTLYKLIICKESLKKAVNLFNINKMVTVDPQNWFEKNYTEIFNKAKYFLSQHSKYSKCIIITCAGMGAKVLVSELHKLFPNNIYLDFGSALDFICTKHFIRRVKNYNESSIQALNAYKPPTGFKQLLPDGF